MNETDRVLQQAKALDEEDIGSFLRLIRESGRSSFMYLQNVYPPNDNIHQSLATGLAISEHLLSEKGAWRVHGGGFAGTIQAFVPNDAAASYIERMESVFGSDACYRLRIRSVGGYEIKETGK
jgi:galactokinase